MAKWQSVLFSDIRNKLGDQVIFSAWKGRVYFRSYAKPTNPNTLKQQAVRKYIKALVERWKTIVINDDIKQAWNLIAQDFNISGYNLFIKEGAQSEIKSDATVSGTGSATVNITYSIGFSPADAGIYRVNPDGTITDITPAEGLLESGTIQDTITTSGTYYYFIADKRVLVEGDTPPTNYQMITKWSKDYTTGDIVEAKTEATIS